MNTFPRLLRCERGATVAWTLGSLHFAAESAARYASLNYDSSGNPPAASTVQTYALNAYYGESLSSNPFTYSATGCGNTVTAAYTYSLAIPFAGTWSIPLSAAACFP